MKPTSGLSYEQLRDLQDCLRRPLDGRHALIPVGPKAFMVGCLRPKKKSVWIGKDPEQQQQQQEQEQEEEEIVSVAVQETNECKNNDQSNDTTNKLLEMTRREAIAYLQMEMDQFRNKKKKKQNQINKTNERTIQDNITTRQQKNEQQQQQQQQESSELPYFEIREELNDNGQEVKSEAINVTKQLKNWEQQVLEAKGRSTNDGGDIENVESKLNFQDDDKNDNKYNDHHIDSSSSSSKHDEENNETMQVDEYITLPSPPRRKQPITDQDYDALISRLDELARLEEEAEQKENEQTKKSLTAKLREQQNNTNKTSPGGGGGGWTKGFLNKSSISVTKPKKNKIAIHEKKSNQTIPSIKTNQTSTAATTTTTNATTNETTAKIDGDINQEKKKVVGFSNETLVQEIPRIGQRSIKEIKSFTTTGQPTTTTTPQKKKQQQQQQQQDDLFMGTVQERKRKPRQRPQPSINNNTASTMTARPPSRFAQQRQHGL